MSATVFKEDENSLDPEFERMFRDHSAFVYRTAYSITGQTQDAEDVVQTVFFRLLRRNLPADVRNNPKAYLHRAAFNASLTVLRTRRRRGYLEGNVEDVPLLEPDVDPRIGEELHERLQAAMDELNPQSAQILNLRYVHNCDLAEIARIVGTTRSTVAVSLFRSRARLKKLIRAAMEQKS